MDIIYNTLTQEQRDKIYAWYNDEVQPQILKDQHDLPEHLTCNRTQPYAGAIGGGLTYSFTPTGLGVITKVRCGLTNKELDVTDYDNW